MPLSIILYPRIPSGQSMVQKCTKWSIVFFVSIMLFNCNEKVEKVEKGATPENHEQQIPDLLPTPKLIKSQNSRKADNINCSLEDKNGNLWFGSTGEGVYLFDGQTFRQFTTTDGLKSNMVFCLFESNSGEIWIGTDTGLNIYDGKKIKDVHIADPVNSVHNKFYVFSIMEDRDGKLWIATVEGVFVYDGKSFEHFTVSNSGNGYISKKHNTEYMLQDAAGNIWFGSRVNDGIFRYDGKSIVNFKLEEINGHKWAWPALQDQNGDIWFSSWGGSYRYDGQSFTSFTTKDGLCSKTIMRIIEDSNGNIWFGGGDGLCRYDGKSITHFTTEDGLPHNGIWSILEDSQQQLWIGTRNTELSKYDGKTFTTLSESKDFQFNVE